MLNPFHTEPRMPWYGYVLANVLVWIFMAVIYFGVKNAWFSAVKSTIDRPGVMSLMIFIPIAFFIASVFDFCYDRYKSPSEEFEAEEPEDSKDQEAIPTARESKDTSKSKR